VNRSDVSPWPNVIGSRKSWGGAPKSVLIGVRSGGVTVLAKAIPIEGDVQAQVLQYNMLGERKNKKG